MRILIAGTGSGSGKTTLTTGLVRILTDRGLRVAALKCGPDYIDPMFYSRITGSMAGNLDPFFSDRDTLRWIAAGSGENCDITVIEGVMGYYDGTGFTSEHSSFSVARALDVPVILVINCRGMGISSAVILKGFLDWPEITSSGIRGVIFNNMPERLYPKAAGLARSMGVVPLGYLPHDPELTLESRHLGLVTAGEISDIRQKLGNISRKMEMTVDVDGILELAAGAPEIHAGLPQALRPYISDRRPGPGTDTDSQAACSDAASTDQKDHEPVRIAVARDDAFCFTYRENLSLLEELGCQLVYFSPLEDKCLPEDTYGLILSGGYPELHAKRLSQNKEMRDSVRNALKDGMPVIAECGGFMYLHEELEGEDGRSYPMAGLLKGRCFRTGRLRRFGYAELTAVRSGLICDKGQVLRAHEFHYWDSENCGDSFDAVKPDMSRRWKCGIMTDTMYAGFPHLFFYESPEVAWRFTEKCMKRRSEKK